MKNHNFNRPIYLVFDEGDLSDVDGSWSRMRFAIEFSGCHQNDVRAEEERATAV